jgi:hypothetical protein
MAIYLGVIPSYLSSYKESNRLAGKLFLMLLNTLLPTTDVIPFIPSSLVALVRFARVDEK